MSCSCVTMTTVMPLSRLSDAMSSMISFALEAKNKGEEDKIYISLNKLLEEDTGLKLHRNAETSEIILSGRGQVHIEPPSRK